MNMHVCSQMHYWYEYVATHACMYACLYVSAWPYLSYHIKRYTLWNHQLGKFCKRKCAL